MSEIEYKPYKTMVMNRFGPNERESYCCVSSSIRDLDQMIQSMTFS